MSQTQIVTMGDFIALLQSSNFSGRSYLDEFFKDINGEGLSEFKAEPFSKGRVEDLAQGLRTVMKRRITGMSQGIARNRELERAHIALREFHGAAFSHGLLIGLKEIDKPITLTEQVLAYGLVAIQEDGSLMPTTKLAVSLKSHEQG